MVSGCSRAMLDIYVRRADNYVPDCRRAIPNRADALIIGPLHSSDIRLTKPKHLAPVVTALGMHIAKPCETFNDRREITLSWESRELLRQWYIR